MPLVAALGLAEGRVGAGDVENVVHDLEEDAELAGEDAVALDPGLGHALKKTYALDGRADEPAGLQLVHLLQSVRAVDLLIDVDELAAEDVEKCHNPVSCERNLCKP